MVAMFASQSYCEVQIEYICTPLGFTLQCCIKGKANTQYLNESLNECMSITVATNLCFNRDQMKKLWWIRVAEGWARRGASHLFQQEGKPGVWSSC